MHGVIIMGKITKAPVYLDATSQLSDAQIKKVNSMIKSQINLFTSRAVQKQKTDKISDVLSAYSPRLSSTVGYKFHDIFYISGILDISGMEEGQTIDLLELSDKPESLSFTGYFDTELKLSLAAFGTYSISDKTVSLTLESIPEATLLSFNIKGRIKEE